MTIFFTSGSHKISPINFTPATKELFTFAVERQKVFFRRRKGTIPWTDNSILKEFKFTNTYRALDRVSQYLIRNVIYKSGFTNSQTFYRILLFKIFNKIETWKALESELGSIIVSENSLKHIESLLDEKCQVGTIFSGAYIMPSGSRQFGFAKKHKSYLYVLQMMIQDELHAKVFDAPSLEHVYQELLKYPLIGPFLGFQFSIDLNYSDFLDFDEMDFVVAGPGAIDGISKCFKSLNMSPENLIRIIAEEQEVLFHHFNLNFETLGGRKLQLIDWQNLFCETSKYTRVSMPEVTGVSGRTRIKQKFRENVTPIDYFFPPKWKIILPPV